VASVTDPYDRIIAFLDHLLKLVVKRQREYLENTIMIMN
jgi:hypothetical protein